VPLEWKTPASLTQSAQAGLNKKREGREIAPPPLSLKHSNL